MIGTVSGNSMEGTFSEENCKGAWSITKEKMIFSSVQSRINPAPGISVWIGKDRAQKFIPGRM